MHLLYNLIIGQVLVTLVSFHASVVTSVCTLCSYKFQCRSSLNSRKITLGDSWIFHLTLLLSLFCWGEQSPTIWMDKGFLRKEILLDLYAIRASKNRYALWNSHSYSLCWREISHIPVSASSYGSIMAKHEARVELFLNKKFIAKCWVAIRGS